MNLLQSYNAYELCCTKIYFYCKDKENDMKHTQRNDVFMNVFIHLSLPKKYLIQLYPLDIVVTHLTLIIISSMEVFSSIASCTNWLVIKWWYSETCL